MSKGGSRSPVPVRRVREAGLSGGGSVELEGCTTKRVRVESERSASELRAMGPAYLALDDGGRVVIRRGRGVIAIVLTELVPLRKCIEAGVRYEADLPRTTDAMLVTVRPLEAR